MGWYWIRAIASLLMCEYWVGVADDSSTTVSGAKMDFHEFYITDNGTALITVYGVDGPTDLTRFGGPSDGFIMVGYAQEINIATGEALWTWKSLDHVDPSLGYASPGETGKAADNPWDYFVSSAQDLLTEAHQLDREGRQGQLPHLG